eukprot:scpid66385/ scgid35036/ 
MIPYGGFLCQNTSSEDSEPHGWYRRGCDAKYTHVKSIAALENASASASALEGHTSAPDPGQDDDEPQPKRAATRSAVADTDKELCLICQEKQKRRKSTGFSAQSSGLGKACVVQAALDGAKRGEESATRMLLEVQAGGSDCVANEVTYHRSCYRDFTRTQRETAESAEDVSPFDTAFAVIKTR